jgi:hypothetical protein
MLGEEPAHLGVLGDQLHDLRAAELDVLVAHVENVLFPRVALKAQARRPAVAGCCNWRM